jgi:hypothetical protein
MGVAPSHLGLLRGGATLTSERQGPLSQGRTVLYATRPKPSAQLIRATRSQQAQKEAERPSEGNRQNSAAKGTWGRDSDPALRQTERLAEIGGERMQQATEASAAAATGTLRSGSAIASDAQEIAAAWTRYAEEVMRHTSEASQALLRARNFSEMLEVQAKLLRDNMQSFLDQSAKIAETASRMATRPLDALKEASGGRTRG